MLTLPDRRIPGYLHTMGRRKTASLVTTFVLLSLLVGCRSWKQFAYEGLDRDTWQQPERVLEVLAIEPGSRIADLGAGSGYFTFDLARATGDEGVVYAVDVDPEMIGLLQEKAIEAGAQNVRTILADPEDSGLPDGEIDLVFTSNTYHHIENQTAYFARLKTDLAPGARVAILDLRPDVGFLQRWLGHSTDAAQIREQMKTAGYELEDEQDFIERQSFLVFTPRNEQTNGNARSTPPSLTENP